MLLIAGSGSTDHDGNGPQVKPATLKKLSELAGVAFDGVRSGYVPPKKLSISSKLKLHRKSKKSIDPVTFEVVRHALWNVNEEHGATIQRLSGSPVAMYALDLRERPNLASGRTGGRRRADFRRQVINAYAINAGLRNELPKVESAQPI